jgi:hypothetical protein
MLYTPNYGFIKPEATDPADGAGQITTLATAVDTELDALQTQVDGKSAASHNHDTAYGTGYVTAVANLTAATTSSSGVDTAYTPTFTMVAGRTYMVFVEFVFTSENSSGVASNDSVAGSVTLRRKIDPSTYTTLSAGIPCNVVGAAYGGRKWYSFTSVTTGVAGTASFGLRLARDSSIGTVEIAYGRIHAIDLGT